ncbi:MAG TPA: hypothetical protein EYN51_03035 [Flavobacteriales bacterium]|nr:hypothetical protein [Flavobacteriales bacterium]
MFSQGERKNILHFLYLLAFGQCLISLLYITDVGVAEILTKSSTPDLVKGTLDSSNSLGYLLLLVLVLNVNWLLENKIKLGKLLVLLLMLGVAFLSDSKAQLVALAASVFIMILFIDFFLIHKRKLLVKTMAIALVIFIPFFVVQNISRLSQKYDSYITGNNNKKLMYYSRAVNYENRPMIQYLIGTGPGTCGSRAANARAYDVLYKGRDAFKLPAFIPAFSSRHTVNMLGDLYTQGYAESTFERSALLGNPFNSIAAFFVELGVIGFAFLLSLFVFVIAQCIHVFNHVKSGIKDKNLALGLILLTLIIIITSMIDQVLERGMMMYLFWFMCAVLINTRRELRSKSS